MATSPYRGATYTGNKNGLQPCLGEIIELFAIYEAIAGLEPYDIEIVVCGSQCSAGNFASLRARCAAAFGNRHPLGIAAGAPKNFGADALIVNNYVGILQCLQGS